MTSAIIIGVSVAAAVVAAVMIGSSFLKKKTDTETSDWGSATAEANKYTGGKRSRCNSRRSRRK